MNCLFLLLLLSCSGNRNNNWDCGDSCENECHNHHRKDCQWRNSIYNVVSDNNCECDRNRDNDRNCDNDIRRDNDRRRDNDCDCDECYDNHREPRIFPPYHNDNCGCND